MTDPFEERIRTQLREEVRVIAPSPDSWLQLTQRINRARTRRVWALGLGVVAIFFISVLGIYAATQRPSKVEIRPAGPLPQDAPESFVGVNSKNRVMVFSSEDGRVVRELAQQQETKTPHNLYRGGVPISTDGEWVYFDELFRYEGRLCEMRIRRVRITGGRPELLVTGGSVPAVSPDGKSLAYLKARDDTDCLSQTLVVRDMSSGREHLWSLRQDSAEKPVFYSSQLGWSPDSRYLLYGLLSQDSQSVLLFDPSAESGWDNSKVLLPDRNNCWSGSEWRRGGGVYMSGGRCRVDEARRPPVIVEYDPIEGRVRSPVPNELQDFIPGGLHSDRTGKHFLLVRRGSRDPEKNELSRWHGNEVISIKKIALLNATWW